MALMDDLESIWEEWYWDQLDFYERIRVVRDCDSAEACRRWRLGESEAGPSGFDILRLVAMGLAPDE